MAQQGSSRQPGFFHFPGLAHFIIVLIVTGLEIVGLVGWLAIARGGAVGSVYGNLPVLSQLAKVDQYISTLSRTRFSAIFLGTFLLIEHLIAQTDQTGRIVRGREFVEILGFTILESLIWTVWLILIPVNGVVAFLFFLGSLFVEHQITDNVKKGLPYLHFARASTRVFLGLVLITIFEVVGAVIWVSMATVIALAIGSTIEHYVARNLGQIREEESIGVSPKRVP
jgi:hypothetical protein